MPNQPSARVLVAETDENGRVACVWIKRQSEPAPHPVRNAKRVIDRFTVFETVGAPRADIASWLAERAGAL